MDRSARLLTPGEPASWRIAARPGIALAASLLVMVFLLVLGLGFLAFVERDYVFAGRQERMARAWYLAVSGLEYFRYRRAEFRTGQTVTRAVPAGDPVQRFEVSVGADGTIRSRGLLLDSQGRPLAQRLLVVPGGRFEELYDADQ